MGHSEGASGLTSVIKAVLALEHKSIPPNIHLHHPNPRSKLAKNCSAGCRSTQNVDRLTDFSKVSFEKAGLRVPLELIPWQDGCAERVSVNCFGVGGSNAHVSRSALLVDLLLRASRLFLTLHLHLVR